MRRAPGADDVHAWAPTLPGLSEVLHAEFVDHRYPRHSHGSWTVLLLDEGGVDFRLDGRPRRADPSRVTVLPPFVAHDGRAADPGRGFRKRVLYLEHALLPEQMIGRLVDEPSLADPVLRSALSVFHRRLAGSSEARDATHDLVGSSEARDATHDLVGSSEARDATHELRAPVEDLELDARLTLLVTRIRDRLLPPSGPRRVHASTPAADALRAHLDAHLADRHTLALVARRLRYSESHLVRSFTARYGLPPHQYLISRRVEAARQRLLCGEPAAQVACAVGFHDQAHLTRHFRRQVGVTPGRYARTGTAAR